ncbi:hypothetical protein FB645_002753 [Coemansia sp. IMI 203386]|nr:hypothetical protein FB645_002753 [Coemansia sp. IMI 203386]
MACNAAFSRFGRSGLLAKTDTHTCASSPAPVCSVAKESGSRKRLSGFLKKAKSTIKNKCSKAFSKLSFNTKRESYVKPIGMTYLYYAPESATVEDDGEYVANTPTFCETSGTTAHSVISETQSSELVPQTSTAAMESGEPCDASSKYADHCAYLDGLVADALDTEDFYDTVFHPCAFWLTGDSFNAYSKAVQYIYRVNTLSRVDCKTFHLGVYYFNQFLADYERPIEAGLVNVYALSCFYVARSIVEGTSRIVMTFPEGYEFTHGEFELAMQQVIRTLRWGIDIVQLVDDNTVVNTVELPTIISFLELAFQRAAIELPARFAEEPEQRPEQPYNSDEMADFPIFAIELFCDACRLAGLLVCNKLSTLHRGSELAAACFFVVTQPEEIDPEIFLKCTKYSLESVELAILFARTIHERHQ